MRTMADVARHAGVSAATVSHVLNATRPVRPSTRDAVLRAIDELGYIHNTLARSLVTSRTRSVGLAVSAISNPYFTEILQGVEAEALASGYGLLIADPHDDPAHELSVVRMLHERRVDGVIIAPSAEPSALLAYLDRADVPVVFLDRLVDEAEEPAYDQVCAEGAAPVRELVEHLAGLGHRRIAMVAGLAGLSTTTERIDGYRQGLARGRPPVRPRAARPRQLRLRRRPPRDRAPAGRTRAPHRRDRGEQRDDHRRAPGAPRGGPAHPGGRRARQLRRLRVGRPLLAQPHRRPPAEP